MSKHKKTPSAPTLEVSDNEFNYQEENVMTNDTTVVDMRQFVQARNGQAFTTTKRVAEAFGKQHKHVLDKVRSIECSDQFLTANFSAVQFDHRGNTYEVYEMTKDGFMFLVMGFTGKKASTIKEGYIAAFNWMAEQLGLSATDLVGAVIGSSGLIVLDRVIDQKAGAIEKGMRRSFKHTMKSRLRTRFNVQRVDLIPEDNLADACNFVAAYALEGEWIGKEASAPVARLDIHYPLQCLLAGGRQGMLSYRNADTEFLDVKLGDLRELYHSPCEQVLGTLAQAGYDVEGAWWEIRTYRNKLAALMPLIESLSSSASSSMQYVIDRKSANRNMVSA